MSEKPEQWAVDLAAEAYHQTHLNGKRFAALTIQRAFEEHLSSELLQQRAAVELEHLAELKKFEDQTRELRERVLSLAKGEIVSMPPGPKATEETMMGFKSGWSSAMGLIRQALGEHP